MLKLTRLNNHIVAINPDHIGWVDATPDTTLALIGGEKIIVRESLDELIALVIQFRRLVRVGLEHAGAPDGFIGDPLTITIPPRRAQSEAPQQRVSLPSLTRTEGR